MSVQDTLATLSSLEILRQGTRDANRRGEARMQNSPKLADFGDKAWPRDPALAVQKDMRFPQLQAVLIELACFWVDHVAVQAQAIRRA